MRHTGKLRANPAAVSDALSRPRSGKRRSKLDAMVALLGVSMACVGGVQTAAAAPKDAARAPQAD